MRNQCRKLLHHQSISSHQVSQVFSQSLVELNTQQLSACFFDRLLAVYTRVSGTQRYLKAITGVIRAFKAQEQVQVQPGQRCR